MGVRKFRSVGDMKGPLPRRPLDPENLENKALGTLVRAYNRTTGAPAWESKLRWKYDQWQVEGGLLCATDGGPNSWRTINYKHAPDSWFTVLDLRTGRELGRSEVFTLATMTAPLVGEGIAIVGTWRYRDNPNMTPEILAFPIGRK